MRRVLCKLVILALTFSCTQLQLESSRRPSSITPDVRIEIIEAILTKGVGPIAELYNIGKCSVHTDNITGGDLYHISKEINGKSTPSNHVRYNFDVEFVCDYESTRYDYEKELRKSIIIKGHEGLRTRKGHDWFEVESISVGPINTSSCESKYPNSVYDSVNENCKFSN